MGFCSNCGSALAEGAGYCANCGTKAAHALAASVGGQTVQAGASPSSADSSVTAAGHRYNIGLILVFCLFGAILGAIMGYLTRPSAMLVGQLPFMVVITGGAFLQGLDQVLVPIAQQSLNQMVAVAIIGGCVGGFVGFLIERSKAR